MKREEKNEISKRKILGSAFLEFGTRGYSGSSINTICTQGDISKGILYHYFKDRDALYLACVAELFDDLTSCITCALDDEQNSKPRLERYFDARLAFFRDRPLHHRLFYDVIIVPPVHLGQALCDIKKPFDLLNIVTLTDLLTHVLLRSDVTIDSAVETFRLYQDFINARCRMDPADDIDPKRHEDTCKHAMDVLLYGIVKREELQ